MGLLVDRDNDNEVEVEFSHIPHLLESLCLLFYMLSKLVMTNSIGEVRDRIVN